MPRRHSEEGSIVLRTGPGAAWAVSLRSLVVVSMPMDDVIEDLTTLRGAAIEMEAPGEPRLLGFTSALIPNNVHNVPAVCGEFVHGLLVRCTIFWIVIVIEARFIAVH